MPTLSIGSDRRAVAAQDGQTVLEAALAAGVPFPFSCRAGNCGACKCHLIDGEVLELPSSAFALTPEEHSAGMVLACRTQLWGDARVVLPDEAPAHPHCRLEAQVSAVERVTADIAVVRLTIESGGPFAFEAGQFARLTFPNGIARDYSMANRPWEPQLEFHIRALPDGLASTYVYRRLAVGDRVRVAGPSGNAWWRGRHTGPLLGLAGGTGLAPLASIVATALGHGSTQPIHLYVGARSEADLYGLAPLEQLAARYANFTVQAVLSDPCAATARRRGMVTEALAADWPDLAGAKLYMAGPPAMVEAGLRLARARGLPASDIHADPFISSAPRMEMDVAE